MSESGTPSQPAGHSSASLARSSALMASGTLVSRLLGLVRIALLAGAIGPLTQVANVWQTANTLPNTIYLLLAGGVLNVVFVPQLTRALAREDKGRDFTDRLITLALIAITGITVIATASAWLLTKLYALSWTGDQLALAVALAYLCLPQIFFYGAYALLGQILNAQEKFGYYMWAPVANNIVAIAGLVAFIIAYPNADTLPLGQWSASMIWLLGGTATLGIIMQAAVLIQPVRRSGFRYHPKWGFRGVGLGSASRMALWTLAVIAVSQTGLLFASNVMNRAVVLQDGVPGKFAYDNAFLIFILPHSLIATSLLTAMLPQLSRAAAADDREALAQQYRHGLRLLGAAMIPIAIAMIVLAPQVTALLLLLSGSEATQAIAQIVMILTLGLLPYGVYLLSQRIFHAYQEGRPPFQLQLVITGISVVAIGAAALVPPQFTAMAIASGQAAAQIIAAVLGVSWVHRRIGTLSLADVRSTYLRALAAALIAAVPTIGIQLGVLAVLEGKIAALVILIPGGLLFFTLYGVVAHRLGVRELAEVMTPLTRRLRRSNSAARGTTKPVPQSRLVLDTSSQDDPGKEPMVRGIDTGTVLGGRYALEELLARRDDTLDYWSAHDQTLDRLVAVTVMPATDAHESMAHAVLDGARRTAGVDDPRLVRVLDVGLEDGRCWIVEEGLSEAISLATLVAEHPLPAEEARRIVGEAAAGLESARRRGLHHLYLNPHAVLRTSEGSVKISGVGVAAAIEQTDDIAAAEASAIDTTDLLSLLYTGLTGRWPGEEIEALRPARRRTDGTLPAPSEVVSGVPGDLDALCRSVFGVDAADQRGPHTPGELAKVLAPWPSEVVRESPFSLDAPLDDGQGGAYAALAASAGASAAATAAHPVESVGSSSEGDSEPGGGAFAAADQPESHRPGSGPDNDGPDNDGPHNDGPHNADQADQTDSVEPGYYRTAAGASPMAAFGSAAPLTTSAPAESEWVGEPQEASSAGSAAGGAEAGSSPALASSAAAGEPRQRYQSSVVLALIAAIVVVAMFLAYGAIQGLGPIGGDGQNNQAGSTPSATADDDGPEAGEDDPEAGEDNPEGDSPTNPEETTQEPEESPGEPLAIEDITSYDPEGDGDENNELTERAIDGDSTTAWRSRTYLAEDWGNLKSGVGLAIDLGETSTVSEVDIDFPEGDYRLEVYVGDEVSRSDSTQLGIVDDASGEVTITGDTPLEGQYVLIWFTRAWAGPNGEIVYVSEVSVR